MCSVFVHVCMHMCVGKHLLGGLQRLLEMWEMMREVECTLHVCSLYELATQCNRQVQGSQESERINPFQESLKLPLLFFLQKY